MHEGGGGGSTQALDQGSDQGHALAYGRGVTEKCSPGRRRRGWRRGGVKEEGERKGSQCWDIDQRREAYQPWGWVQAFPWLPPPLWRLTGPAWYGSQVLPRARPQAWPWQRLGGPPQRKEQPAKAEHAGGKGQPQCTQIHLGSGRQGCDPTVPPPPPSPHPHPLPHPHSTTNNPIPRAPAHPHPQVRPHAHQDNSKHTKGTKNKQSGLECTHPVVQESAAGRAGGQRAQQPRNRQPLLVVKLGVPHLRTPTQQGGKANEGPRAAAVQSSGRTVRTEEGKPRWGVQAARRVGRRTHMLAAHTLRPQHRRNVNAHTHTHTHTTLRRAYITRAHAPLAAARRAAASAGLRWGRGRSPSGL